MFNVDTRYFSFSNLFLVCNYIINKSFRTIHTISEMCQIFCAICQISFLSSILFITWGSWKFVRYFVQRSEMCFISWIIGSNVVWFEKDTTVVILVNDFSSFAKRFNFCKLNFKYPKWHWRWNRHDFGSSWGTIAICTSAFIWFILKAGSKIMFCMLINSFNLLYTMLCSFCLNKVPYKLPSNTLKAK